MSEHAHDPNQDPLFAQGFVDTLESVTAYNNRHTGLGSAVRGIFGMIMSQVEDYKEPAVSPQEEADMEKELVQLIRTDELAAMGVSLFDSNAPGIEQVSAKEMGEEGKRPATLILLITDGEKFGETIQRLKPSPEQDGQVKGGINMLLGQSASLIKAGYAITPEGDEGATHALRQIVEQQLEMFTELNPTLVMQGYGELPAHQKLAEYTARYASGTLGDYIGAESLGLLQEGFGPAGWQRDSSAEQLSKRWCEAFGYLMKLRDHEEPTPFYSELFTKLRGDFDTAQKWIDGDTTDEHRPGYSDEYIKPLKKQITELSRIWDEHFQLESAFYDPAL